MIKLTSNRNTTRGLKLYVGNVDLQTILPHSENFVIRYQNEVVMEHDGKSTVRLMIYTNESIAAVIGMIRLMPYFDLLKISDYTEYLSEDDGLDANTPFGYAVDVAINVDVTEVEL